MASGNSGDLETPRSGSGHTAAARAGQMRRPVTWGWSAPRRTGRGGRGGPASGVRARGPPAAGEAGDRRGGRAGRERRAGRGAPSRSGAAGPGAVCRGPRGLVRGCMPPHASGWAPPGRNSAPGSRGRREGERAGAGRAAGVGLGETGNARRGPGRGPGGKGKALAFYVLSVVGGPLEPYSPQKPQTPWPKGRGVPLLPSSPSTRIGQVPRS